jgi:hypothetical protein
VPVVLVLVLVLVLDVLPVALELAMALFTSTGKIVLSNLLIAFRYTTDGDDPSHAVRACIRSSVN